MRGLQRKARTWMSVTIATAALAGCHGYGPKRVAVAEPGLTGPVEAGTAVVDGGTVGRLTWFERHPLFARPAEIYHTTPHGVIVKTAAAAVVGIPVGVVHEIKQIVVGAPPDTHY